MPKPYPEEFREDVVRVARNRPEGVTLEQIADDFGITDDAVELAAKRCRRGRQPARRDPREQAELRELQARNRLLEQENEVLRRAAAYLSQANLPGK